MNLDQFVDKWAVETLGRTHSAGPLNYYKPVLRSYNEIIAVRLPFDKPPFFYMIPKEAVHFLSVTTQKHWRKARNAADMAGTLIPGCCHNDSWFQTHPDCPDARDATRGICLDVEVSLRELEKFQRQLMRQLRRPVKEQREKLSTWKHDLELLLPWCGDLQNKFQQKLNTIRVDIL